MNIIIIDDHPIIRKGLQALFSLDAAINVSGEATNCTEALYLLKKVEPDIALIDLRLGGESGFNLIKEVQCLNISCKFVILTSSVAEDDFKKAQELGVEGYLLKEALPEELLHCLHVVSKGKKYYDPAILDLVMNANTFDSHIEQLTPKEIEVLIELGKGLSNKDISNTLYITEYTVKKHVSQIFAKLSLADRTQAALYANAKGLVKYVVNH